jgi:Flp pilus assembly protein TadG
MKTLTHSRRPELPPLIRRAAQGYRRSAERGVAGVEFALVLPLFLLLVFFLLAVAVMAFSALFAATGVPVEARAFALRAASPGTLAGLETTAGAAGQVSRSPASYCERAVQARLYTQAPLAVPLLPEVTYRLRGGSISRDWRFWPGPADDGCH